MAASTRESAAVPEYMNSGFPASLLADLQSALWNHAGIVRSNAGIQDGMRQLASMKQKHGQSLSYADAMRARNIHDAAYLVLHSASLRKESRGGHFNTDYQSRTAAGPTRIAGSLAQCWRSAGQETVPA